MMSTNDATCGHNLSLVEKTVIGDLGSYSKGNRP